MKNEVMIIGDGEIEVKEYQGIRVITFKDIDFAHKRPDGTARRNFNKNRLHFIEGTDYFKICANDVRTHNVMNVSPMVREDITFLTETGYLMLVKSFTDDLSWEVQRMLVNSYFKQKENKSQQDAKALPMSYKEAVAQLLQQLEENERLESENKILVPKAEYHDEVLNKSGLLTATLIAKDLGMSASKLNALMFTNRIIFKQGRSWKPYAEYEWLITEGYADYQSYTQENAEPQLKWTEKGRQWIIENLPNWQ